MRNHLDALIPLFLDVKGKRFSLLGSGTLIKFRGEIFILTAGHVIDGFNTGELMVPRAGNRIDSIEGVYSFIPSDRGSDRLDFGYFKLDKSFANELENVFYAVPESEFGIRTSYSKQELMSFGGFPHRKHNVAGGVATTKEYIYSAYHADTSDYEAFSCNPETNIVAKFNRKKTVNAHNGNVQIAPLPHGISGGGIFTWPATLKELIPNDRRLIGICHTYEQDRGCFIGTRLEIVLGKILKNNPQLAMPT